MSGPSSLQWLSFLEEINLPSICLDMKSSDFIVGKLLNTTNAVRYSIHVFLATPSQPSDLLVDIFCEVEI